MGKSRILNCQMQLKDYRLLASTIQPSKKASCEEVTTLIELLGLTPIISRLVTVRNSSPSAYDCVMTFLNGSPIRSTQLLYGFTGNALYGRVALNNTATRDGALRRIGITSNEQLTSILSELSITEKVTISEALDTIHNEAKKEDSYFAQYSAEVTEVAILLKEILS